ncbi:PA14 domain-containing protein [Filimonas lacunae]|uniref:PA14 domain-containing protein n=1 Tax=Filimonas lacunae TaxID=477680 RepID=A0A173MJF5_9BACT|nr:PA14 domain-containing protein [Filimonas lacunae]BAV07630.1 hypothetical protein FLA_3656 [Filimonas lacunae]SIT29738.1 PA14 domain-containing protein [Filimonas lacunae]
MILAIIERRRKIIALSFLFMMYAQGLLGAYTYTVAAVPANYIKLPAHTYRPLNRQSAQALTENSVYRQTATPLQQPSAVWDDVVYYDGGPSQPEMQQFASVNTSNMVDLFTGDFSYNIPLLDVGGYPVNISYRSGVSMDEEASWVGLGWNINPGTIARNMRGVPDDFNGGADTIRKTAVTKENKTIGVTAGAGFEMLGLPLGLGASLGMFHNTYKGWGLETGLNVSINSGEKASGPLTGGLSVSNNSQEGLTFSPNMGVKIGMFETENKNGYGTLSLGTSYNSRAGLSGLQLSGGIRLSEKIEKNGRGGNASYNMNHTAGISFGYPSFTPTINMPYTGRQFSFTAKVGFANWTADPNFSISGYVSKQVIAEGDRTLVLPAYGYLNYQNSLADSRSLIDFNREKDIPFRDKPAVPHIAIPSYTYDVFSVSGEGVGGSFRAYRGDIGYIHDHYMKTNDASDRVSVDVGVGTLFHGGVDVNSNRSYTETGAWVTDNPITQTAAFRKSSGKFEAAYFRNPGEKTVNSKAFYNTIGGDEVVVPQLYQPSQGSSYIGGTNSLNIYKNKRLAGSVTLTAQNAVKPQRDKRSQVINYLTAEEADKAGLSKYIETHTINSFKLGGDCDQTFNDEYDYGVGNGMIGKYYNNRNLKGDPSGIRIDTFFWLLDNPKGSRWPGVINNDNYSIQWTARFKAPETGTYYFRTYADDGTRLWINDSLVLDDWSVHAERYFEGKPVNLVAGEIYNLRLEYFEATGRAVMSFEMKRPSASAYEIMPGYLMYNTPLKDSFVVGSSLTKEKRVSGFRKKNHISEISVLNADGRKYVYGIPVYNLGQKEVTFSVDKSRGNSTTGLASYTPNVDNTVNNTRGRDNYFSAEEMPAYAHSYLLTGIVSPDYVDVTNNGISDDDLGDAIKFNYTKTAGIANPYRWRAPYVQDSATATYNEGLRTDSRDDKANYVSGTKEIWYLQTIESKNMVAAFFLDGETRKDGIDISENGRKAYSGKIRRLRKIALYNKPEFLQKDTLATPVKTVYFEYTYELCKGYNKPLNDSGKLTLKKIWFTYNGNEKGKKTPYVFTYHSNNPDYNIKSYDRWGNYKSPADNPTTSGEVANADYPYALQDSTKASVNVAAWTLSEIKLPSGGVIKATYESDDYAYVQNKRSMQMCKLAGLSYTSNANDISNNLYGGSGDNLYAFIKVPVPVTSVSEVKSRYLDGIDKMYFRLYVSMPGDKWGNGYEYVPCYADIQEGQYGFSNDMIWVKLKGMGASSVSPLAKTAIQFLRLNLPSKAYPGSDVGDNIDLGDGVRILLTMADNILQTVLSFNDVARLKNWAKKIDLNRSFARVTCPTYKRLGGGLRVKRVTIYDNWNAMTQQQESTYGQEYTYTTTKEVNGVKTEISSGVALYEPGIGGEENPFHLPIEYSEQASALAPVTMGYTEEPLGESFYPGASIGYSKVRVRSIHTQNRRSAMGFEESCFYTAYDFPTMVDRSVLDDDTKKRYKPGLANFLRIDAKHYVTASQGFKIELNDMHGKPRSQATYSATDPDNYITYSENFYKVENQSAAQKQLSNTVMAMNADSSIDSEAFIGKDAELLLDMREQKTVVNGLNVSVNADVIPFFLPPVLVIPTAYGLTQREETRFRSSAAVKVIQRFGILDSLLVVDKGSKVTTKNLLYDSETGDVLLTRTQNEFDDPVYNFTYPSHWAYEGMAMAYKNIDVTLSGIFIKDGKLTKGLPTRTTVDSFFTSGDEMLVASKMGIAKDTGCKDIYTTFPVFSKVWAVDANTIKGGAPDIYFVDKEGHAFSGNDITLKIVRSGRRNIAGTVGSVTCLNNPVVYTNGKYSLQLNTASQVLNASVAHYAQVWKVGDKKAVKKVPGITCQTCCIRPIMDYLFSSAGSVDLRRVYSNPITVAVLAQHASNNGFGVDISCPLLYKNKDKKFYHYAKDSSCSNGTCTYNFPAIAAGKEFYRFQLGDIIVKVTAARYFPADAYLNAFHVRRCPSGNVAEFISAYPVDSVYTYQVPIDTSYMRVYGANGFRIMYYSCDGTVDLQHPTPILPMVTVHQVSQVGIRKGEVTVIYYKDGALLFGNTLTLNPTSVQACTITDANETYATIEVVGNTCDTIMNPVCYSPITDTVLNPYSYGVLGNFKADSVYTYYGQRNNATLTPLVNTNIRADGAFAEFVPFWKFANGKLKANPDTSKWVWTSISTLFNVKGFELENKDPLNRYNAGLYGYNQTLPVAVVQNSRYRESGYEGFEDYFYGTDSCSTLCPVGRHFDFSSLKSYISTEQQHTGKYSLKIASGTSLGFAAMISNAELKQPAITFSRLTDNCSGTYLQSVKADSTSLLPVFTPAGGKKILISTWVKEMRDCKCESYTGNKIDVYVKTAAGYTTLTLLPMGDIIEGWQRYESVVTLAADATQLSVNFTASGSSDVYFDDIRIHPYNANMKSFVYNSTNLRLMAELDENNYATFYEYDDDGTLIRVKKETQRGVKTIKETRSALRVIE